MQQITQCKYYRFGWAHIRLGPRATAPSAPPPLNPPLPRGRDPQFEKRCTKRYNLTRVPQA